MTDRPLKLLADALAQHELLEAARAVLSESSGDSPPSIGALARLQEAIEKATGEQS